MRLYLFLTTSYQKPLSTFADTLLFFLCSQLPPPLNKKAQSMALGLS